MIIRKFTKKDFNQVKILYKNVLNFNCTEQIYDFFYYNNSSGEYSSFIAEVDGNVVGHNALVVRNYNYNQSIIKLGLSSGGMVDPSFSGIFFNILKRLFKEYSYLDGLIAFPNKHSEGFFTKFFNFEGVSSNYFSITKTDQKKIENQSPVFFSNSLVKNEFDKRILEHPFHNYEINETDQNKIVYKVFNNNEMDIIYCHRFNSDFVDFIDYSTNHFKKINIISSYPDFLYELGFKALTNNIFVYKFFNKIIKSDFNCQMIDSDVF